MGRQQTIIVILVVGLIATFGYIYFLFNSPSSPLRSEASIPTGSQGQNSTFVRVGTVTEMNGNNVTFDEVDVGSSTIEATAQSPIRTLNAQGRFEISTRDKLTVGDLVSFNFMSVSGQNILRSVDILTNK